MIEALRSAKLEKPNAKILTLESTAGFDFKCSGCTCDFHMKTDQFDKIFSESDKVSIMQKFCILKCEKPDDFILVRLNPAEIREIIQNKKNEIDKMFLGRTYETSSGKSFFELTKLFLKHTYKDYVDSGMKKEMDEIISKMKEEDRKIKLLEEEIDELVEILPTGPYTIPFGSFKISSGALRVTDPCYAKDVWCSGTLDNVKNGDWWAEALYITSKGWGTRVSEIRIFAVHQETGNSDWINSDIHVGVDSGQAGFFDEELYPEGEGDYGDKNSFYGQVCELTFGAYGAGTLEYGAVSCSGYGDGGYECLYKTNESGKVVAAKIIFITEEEEDGD